MLASRDKTTRRISLFIGIPFLSLLLLVRLLQGSDDGVAHLRCAGIAAQVLGANAAVNGGLDGLLNSNSVGGQLQRVAQHHGNRQNGADGVDNALARDIGGRAVDGLVDAVALALAVGDAAQGGTGQQANAAGDDAGLVADNVTKQVAGNDDAVEGAGVLDHEHGGGVNQVVAELDLGELLGENLGDDLAPQAGGGQDVGLVQAPHGQGVLGVGSEGQVAAEAGDALNFGARVGLGVEGRAVAVVLTAVAKVNTTRQLTDDGEVGAAADLGLEGGEVDKLLGGEGARAQVAESLELFPELQQALLGADRGVGTPLGAANGAQQDGVGSAGGGKCLVGQSLASLVDGGLERGVRQKISSKTS